MRMRVAIVCSAVLLAACANNPALPATSSALLQASMQDDAQTLRIEQQGRVVSSISMDDIPPFDTGIDDHPSVPRRDYAIASTAVDQAGARIYFSVRNRATAGNVNVSAALFAKDLPGGAITLLAKREYTSGFGTLALSPDGRTLLVDDGMHGGLCYNTLGLVAVDAQSGKELLTVMLPDTTGSWIEFSRWIDSNRFAYRENTFKDRDECLRKQGADPVMREKEASVPRS